MRLGHSFEKFSSQKIGKLDIAMNNAMGVKTRDYISLAFVCILKKWAGSSCAMVTHKGKMNPHGTRLLGPLQIVRNDRDRNRSNSKIRENLVISL
jgi:hypothetical protein